MPRATTRSDDKYIAADDASSDLSDDGVVASERFRKACDLMAKALWKLEKCEKQEIDRSVLKLHFEPLQKHVADLLSNKEAKKPRDSAGSKKREAKVELPAGVNDVSSNEVSPAATPEEPSLCQRVGTRVEERHATRCICGKMLDDDFVSYYNEGLLGNLELKRLQAYLKVHGLRVPDNAGDVLSAIIENMRKEWLEVERTKKDEVARMETMDEGLASLASSASSIGDVKELNRTKDLDRSPAVAPAAVPRAASDIPKSQSPAPDTRRRHSSSDVGSKAPSQARSSAASSPRKSVGSSAAARLSQPSRPPAGGRASSGRASR